jgi:hypothetical protein
VIGTDGDFHGRADRILKAAPAVNPRGGLKNKDFDKPVTIIGEAGVKDGIKYFTLKDGTGIPENELTFQ